MIELSDVIFAVDSIPAVFAVTTDPFIVLTSNIFAILGLRAMYFLLADVADRFVFLKYGLAFVLSFIGVKCWRCTGYTSRFPFPVGRIRRTRRLRIDFADLQQKVGKTRAFKNKTGRLKHFQTACLHIGGQSKQSDYLLAASFILSAAF